ncbi:MAG: hypothetical protein FJX35_04785 [Alphaproteobacteria bacterium]|nr:hypothetical protein [Alphaproteobacteria bacterium]
MKRPGTYLAAAAILLSVTVARSGHELPVYPSYYPHEIQLETVAPDRAGGLLSTGKLHAYIGAEPRFSGAPPDAVRSVESLGSLIAVRINPQSPHARDAAERCAIVTMIQRHAVRGAAWRFHPYPVTPMHGDYLQHADRAAAALAAASAAPDMGSLKVRADSRVAAALLRSEWQADTTWDAEIVEADLGMLTASRAYAMNGWSGPPWLRAGWFHAQLLLGAVTRTDTETAQIDELIERLETGRHISPADRINLERDLVAALGKGCHAAALGYTVRREYTNAEFSAGIENVGYDWLDGIASGIFLRTAKLKDFPWNGWLAVGISDRHGAAWNPIAGMTDRFGRLMWSAVGDAALLPSPYGPGWMINRVSDIKAGAP